MTGSRLAEALALEAAHAATQRWTRRPSVRRVPPPRHGAAMSDEPTQERVVDAAVACILDEGFYRASSNKIAKRAGVTWGVIQYHFGTREALHGGGPRTRPRGARRVLADAVIVGKTIEAAARVLRRRALGVLPPSRVPRVHAGRPQPQPRPHHRRLDAAGVEVLPPPGGRPAAGNGAGGGDGPLSDAEVEHAGCLYNVVRGLALDQDLLDASRSNTRVRRRSTRDATSWCGCSRATRSRRELKAPAARARQSGE